MKAQMPTRSITFPVRCVVCGGNPTRFRTVSATKGLDLLIIRYTVKTHIQVPICDSCNRRRTLATWLIHPLVFIASIALIITGLALFMQTQTDLTMLGSVCSVLGIVLFVLQRAEMIDSMLDYRLLGVRGVTHQEKGELTTVAIRDAKLCSEVEALTKEAESDGIGGRQGIV